MPKMRPWPGLLPGPAGGAYSAPPGALAGFKGATSKGRGGQGRSGKGGEEKGKEGVERDRGREGEGAYRYFFYPTLSSDNNHSGGKSRIIPGSRMFPIYSKGCVRDSRDSSSSLI